MQKEEEELLALERSKTRKLSVGVRRAGVDVSD